MLEFDQSNGVSRPTRPAKL